MTNDLLLVLTRFHREVMYPEMKRLLDETVQASERRLLDQMRRLRESLDQPEKE